MNPKNVEDLLVKILAELKKCSLSDENLEKVVNKFKKAHEDYDHDRKEYRKTLRKLKIKFLKYQKEQGIELESWQENEIKRYDSIEGFMKSLSKQDAKEFSGVDILSELEDGF